MNGFYRLDALVNEDRVYTSTGDFGKVIREYEAYRNLMRKLEFYREDMSGISDYKLEGILDDGKTQWTVTFKYVEAE